MALAVKCPDGGEADARWELNKPPLQGITVEIKVKIKQDGNNIERTK